MEDPNKPSLLILNDDCILHIFKHLEFEECVNLAESCVRLHTIAHNWPTNKKFANVEVNAKMIQNGKDYINRIFSKIGHHVLTLQFHCIQHESFGTDIYQNIRGHCKNVKNLRFVDQTLPHCLPCDYVVETLTLDACKIPKVFFNNFRNLKVLNFDADTNVSFMDLKKFFENNRGIESFKFWCWHWNSELENYYFPDFRLFELVQLKSLCIKLDPQDPNDSDWNMLLKLKLTKLHLRSEDSNINEFLVKLAENDFLEELELEKINVNENTIESLKSYKTLTLLAIEAYHERTFWSTLPIDFISNVNFELVSSFWPENLKHLSLSMINISLQGFLSLIHNLKQLENLNISNCVIVEEDKIYFENVTELSEKIFHSKTSQLRLNLVLPNTKADQSGKYVFDSAKLRILNNNSDYWPYYDPLGNCIKFPFTTRND